MVWCSSQADSGKLRALGHESTGSIPDVADLIDALGCDELSALHDLQRAGHR
jgi:hypothetical protein